MTDEEQILKGIEAIGRGKKKTFEAVVKENYPDKDIVDVECLAGTLYTGVRKRAAIGANKGVVITPVKGSSVIVSRIGESDELFVEMFSEIEHINVTVGNENLYAVLSDFIKEVQKIIVVQGTSPNVPTLTQINQRLNKILC
jgi:hypothetical protein